MDGFMDLIIDRANFWASVVLLMIGLYAMITKNNLVKKLIGMSIFQTAIILLYVSASAKEGADIPILPKEAIYASAHHGDEKHDAEHGKDKKGHKEKDAYVLDPDKFGNPLPHVLMLTAIVVGVSTLGVALAVCLSLFGHFGSLEEDEILTQIKTSEDG